MILAQVLCEAVARATVKWELTDSVVVTAVDWWAIETEKTTRILRTRSHGKEHKLTTLECPTSFL